jgi:hypothetical protein
MSEKSENISVINESSLLRKPAVLRIAKKVIAKKVIAKN